MDPNTAFNISRVVLILAGLCTAAGGVGVLYYGNIISTNQNTQIQLSKTEAAKANAEAAKANKKTTQLDLDIAKANKETENAKAIAEGAKLQSSELNLEVKNAQLQAEKAKIDREKLKQTSLLMERENENLKNHLIIEKHQRYSAERRINPRKIGVTNEVIDALKKFKNIEVKLYYIDGGEPYAASTMLEFLFISVGWKIVHMEAVQSTLRISDGITIEKNVGGPQDGTSEASSQLRKQINKMGVVANVMPPINGELPINTIRVTVGHKPTEQSTELKPPFENIDEQHDYWTQELFKDVKEVKEYSKYSGKIRMKAGNRIHFGKVQSIETNGMDLKYLSIFKNGLFYPDLLGEISLKVSNLKEVEFLSEQPKVKKFRCRVSSSNMAHPKVYLFELQNENATENTDWKSWIKQAKLTFIKFGWSIPSNIELN